MIFIEAKEERLNKSDILWRYISLHKFLYLLFEKKLLFTRLDLFLDPFEGVTMRLIQERAAALNFPERKYWNPNIPVEALEAHAEVNRNTLTRYKVENPRKLVP